MNCTCEDVGNGMMKQDSHCLVHGREAQYFENERHCYMLKIKSAQQSVQRTAIAAGGLGLFAGVVIGWLLGVR